MPRERLSRRKMAAVLRLKWQEQRSAREIARSVGIGRTTVAQYLARAAAEGLSWPLPEGLDAAALARRLFGDPEQTLPGQRVAPDWQAVHQALRGEGVTLALLGQEYQERHPDGWQYRQCCAHYRAWRGRLDIVMRQRHRAGEQRFVDYAGHTAAVIDRTTGEVRQAQVFVAVWGAANDTYAAATWSQPLPAGSALRSGRWRSSVGCPRSLSRITCVAPSTGRTATNPSGIPPTRTSPPTTAAR